MSRIKLAVVLSLVLGACTPASAGTGFGVADLVAALQQAGASVQDLEALDQEFFSAPGRRLSVAGQDVQVFEYADESERAAESDAIQPDGAPNATTMVMWIDQPNFFARGRLIVLYLGRDPALINLLTETLGEPLTEPSAEG